MEVHVSRTKATKEEMSEGLKKLEERTKDKLYNGADKELDRQKKIKDDEALKEKAFLLYKDNKKKLDAFLLEFNVPDVYTYKVDNFRNSAIYSFCDYDMYGKSSKENQDAVLEKHKSFLSYAFITKLNLTKHDTYNYLNNPYDIMKARRIREEYLAADKDTRYFIPEFIINIPKDHLTEYFYVILVANNICHGILSKDQVSDELNNRLKWDLYPVMFANKEHGNSVREKITSSVGFFNEHPEYIF